MSITNVELVCSECGKTVSFSVSDIGTVQECPQCGAYVDVELPDEVRPQVTDDEITAESERQWKESARQLDVAKQHQDETERQLAKTGDLQAQAQELILRLASLTSRCEQIAERVEAALRKWEGHASA